MAESKIESILAADCGNAATVVALIEAANGQYRLIATGRAASTHNAPWRDITLGLQQAIHQIEKEAGRTLLASGGRPIIPRNANRQGVDVFIAVSSAGPPLAIALAGLMHDISLTSARRATGATYTRLTTELSLDSEDNSGRRSIEAQIQAIEADLPDVILLVGGVDGGAEHPVIEMAKIVSMALQILPAERKPAVIFSGNSDVRPQVAEILGPLTDLSAIDNVRPTLDTENPVGVQAELANLYQQRKMAQLPGMDKLRQWSPFPPIPVSQSFEKTIAYIGQHNHLNVMGVNIGSGAAMISTQTQDQHASTIRSDAGLGHSLPALLKAVPLERIQRWLPFELDPTELRNQLLNKCLYPATIPSTDVELMIEYALAREALRLTVDQARAGWPFQPALGRREVLWNLLIGAGSTLTHSPQVSHAAMILLDAIEPWGVTSLALDMHGVVNTLGAIAAVQPVAAVELAAHQAFLNLGTVIAPAGHGYPGKLALNLKIEYATGDTLNLDIPYGVIQAVNLPPGQKATLQIRPTRYFDIGLGQPGRGALAEVEGGALGIIIDTRGRPLRLAADNAQRYEQLKQWPQGFESAHKI